MIYFIHTVIMRFISRTSVFLQKFLELPYLLTLRGRTESIINVDVLFTF